MSRIQKYRESLHRFIKDKSCLYNECDDEELNNFIYKKIKENDLIFPILLLTIMNHNNKKNHIASHGYFFASSVEFFNSVFYLIENKKDIALKLGDGKYAKLYNNLYFSISKSFQQNIESLKDPYEKDNRLINVIISALDIHNRTFKSFTKFSDLQFLTINRGCSGNITKWYLKDDTERIEKFKKLRRLSKDSMNEYIEKKYQLICELSIVIGWVMGGGDLESISKVKLMAKYLAIMYKISLDYRTMDKDLDQNKELYTTNFVLNYGLEESYSTFLQNKEKFIEESMNHKIYTTTIKEIIDNLEHSVDIVVEKSSPDLKSSYSSYSTNKIIE
ncbi:hypothetical protein Indivirus_1_163 [Indivirus ILV1]|uniref:Uncharacterized protein n=1 Tax=Indivirus ILV1 TaxID=1977633 RepID=A0A1V0SCU0_9VIRU|nr:hypothetical protein Indivirus_1_163 [Indivirus ILV1]